MIDALARMGPASKVRLVRTIAVGAASMSSMTARLIEAGYVTRVTDSEEARANILRDALGGRASFDAVAAKSWETP